MADGAGYTFEVKGPVYQAGEGGLLHQVDAADMDPTQPFFLIPDEAAHEQGDEPTELGPEWKPLGFYTPDEHLAEVETSGAAALRAEEAARRQ